MLSIYSRRNTNPILTINPKIKAIAIFITLLGLTGFLGVSTASITLTLPLGTNSLATSLMLKAGANEGATGENAIVYNVSKVDIILGAIGIICANSSLGELTPQMAKVIAESPVKKVLIPLNRGNVVVAGTANKPLPHYIDDAIEIVKSYGGKEYV